MCRRRTCRAQLASRKPDVDIAKAFEYVFPPGCYGCGVAGSVLCATCRPRRSDATVVSLSLLTVRALAPYSGALRRAILAYKRGRCDAGDTLSALLAEHLAGRLSAATVLVPVPTAAARARERGFDQGVRLAQRLGAGLALPVLVALERRSGDAQRGRSRAGRLAARGRFLCTSPELVAGVRIVLVDDVVTTGATLFDCASVLQECGGLVGEAVVLAYA
jgi:ComF family protein